MSCGCQYHRVISRFYCTDESLLGLSRLNLSKRTRHLNKAGSARKLGAIHLAHGRRSCYLRRMADRGGRQTLCGQIRTLRRRFPRHSHSRSPQSSPYHWAIWSNLKGWTASRGQSRSVERIQRGVERIDRLMDDLSILVRSRMRVPFQLKRTNADLGGNWDRERLGQIVFNLVVNAVIHASAKLVHIS